MQTAPSQALQGKRVVVLGGTSGIGFATAEMAAQEGATIVVASSRRESVDRAIARLPKVAEGYVVDLTDEEQIRAFFKQLGAFDHLAFTSGEAISLSTLGETNVEQARHAFDLRFWGAFMAVQYGCSQMRPGGSIVLTSGIIAQRPRKGWLVGAGVVGAIEALTRALAIELAPLRVNAVSPGYVITEMWGSISREELAEQSQRIGQTLPLARVGLPHDLAQAYLYLMCEGFCTGQVIVVDGGATLV